MWEVMEEVRSKGLLDPTLGKPRKRHPRTAIVNFVGFHVEVVSSLAFHFAKLRHNVTVFAREDYGMQGVVWPFHRKNFKRVESFFRAFHEFDTIVWATFPTCHLQTYMEILSFGLPQRHLMVVHNPDYLTDPGVASAIAQGDARLLTIAPHVGQHALQLLALQGVHPQHAWIAPMMPVVFPEECSTRDWTWAAPACRRGRVWQGQEQLPHQLQQQAQQQHAPQPQRQSICIQGKLDPTRRDYYGIFAAMQARAGQLQAANFSLVLVGRGELSLPGDLVEAGLVRQYTSLPFQVREKIRGRGYCGLQCCSFKEEGLVRQYTSLPFQEYYEVLHGCSALLPAFNSPAYYLTKGSSSVGASLIAGTPLVATPQLLGAYSFLDESAVVMVEDGAADLEAMLHVLQQPADRLKAKRLALEALRRDLYDRNFEVLQRLLGTRYLWRQKFWRPAVTESYHKSLRVDLGKLDPRSC
ncbi:hypothetical protein N2152v2_008545 [Parachlorella kessleri]